MSDKVNIDEIIGEFQKLKKSFDLDRKKTKLIELEAKTTDPQLWDDQENARKLMQELGDLKNEIEEIKKLGEDITTLKEYVSFDEIGDELASEIGKIKRKMEKLKVSSFLSGKYDLKNAIVGIHAGQGGTEAMDWVSMLYRMYLKYCEKSGWKVDTLDVQSGEEAGIKSVIFKVDGKYAYGYLKGEMGTHRLVRQSPFNADKLRQTSFALVEVLPELSETDLPDIEIRDDDLDWQFFRASGQGGQNVQKVSTAVRLTHKPTGIVVTSQTERYQEQNRKYALNHLRAKLWLKKQAEEEAEKKQIKGKYRPASWGTQIRSYVLHPYKMVKDIRTEVESSNPESVLGGDLDQFIEAELKLGNSS
jgi:peptide chain release factor 2